MCALLPVELGNTIKRATNGLVVCATQHSLRQVLVRLAQPVYEDDSPMKCIVIIRQLYMHIVH